jgi:hypothetical protein
MDSEDFDDLEGYFEYLMELGEREDAANLERFENEMNLKQLGE